jgi:hypothetical protein
MAILNAGGMDAKGYLPLEPAFRARFQAAYIWVDMRVTAINDLLVTGPSPEPFSKHFGEESSDQFISSPCGGGMLKIWYEVRAAGSNAAPTKEFPVQDAETERWEFGTSLSVGKCWW